MAEAEQIDLTGDDGAAHFAATLPQCATLKQLDLSRNEIGTRGGMALAAALKSGRESGNPFEKCFLWSNNLSDKVKAALPKALVKV